MITNEQLDATYHQMIAEQARILEEEDKTIETINDFEWDYQQFNKRMIELYPSSYIANYWLLVKDYITKYLLEGSQND